MLVLRIQAFPVRATCVVHVRSRAFQRIVASSRSRHVTVLTFAVSDRSFRSSVPNVSPARPTSTVADLAQNSPLELERPRPVQTATTQHNNTVTILVAIMSMFISLQLTEFVLLDL